MRKKLIQTLYRFLYELPTLCLLIVTCISCLVFLIQKHNYDARQILRKAETVQPVTPDSIPVMSQESIDRALAMFDIDVPAGTIHPTFDQDLQDRGLTTLRGWGSDLEVSVGPAAFESWGLLGSTLAHELEVHCRQNFTLIRALDLLGMSGTQMAEREAYQHELSNARRFNLAAKERANIQATMDFYYPLEESGSLTAR